MISISLYGVTDQSSSNTPYTEINDDTNQMLMSVLGIIFSIKHLRRIRSKNRDNAVYLGRRHFIEFTILASVRRNLCMCDSIRNFWTNITHLSYNSLLYDNIIIYCANGFAVILLLYINTNARHRHHHWTIIHVKFLLPPWGSSFSRIKNLNT